LQGVQSDLPGVLTGTEAERNEKSPRRYRRVRKPSDGKDRLTVTREPSEGSIIVF